ncbi:hypothetical protein AHAS_Ahas05G0096100 [Arachis hypogaea]
MDAHVGSSQFFANFVDIIANDVPHHFQYQPSQTPQPQMDDVQGYRPHMDDIQGTLYQPSQTPHHQPQFHVDLNEPTGTPYDSWFSMGGIPPSAYGVGMHVDPLLEQPQRTVGVRRAARCDTWSHLVGVFGDDSHMSEEDHQDP